jgi:hypothetical protein
MGSIQWGWAFIFFLLGWFIGPKVGSAVGIGRSS